MGSKLHKVNGKHLSIGILGHIRQLLGEVIS